MISVVCWLWKGKDPRRVFLPIHATTLARSFRRTLSVPHRFICITDEAAGFGPEVEVVKTPPAAARLAAIETPEGSRFPSCYRRLWNFSDEAREILGESIFAVDIDLVVLRDLAPLLDTSESFVGWRPRAMWGKSDRVGGGMYFLRAGRHQDVFGGFRGEHSIKEARKFGYRGSDQAWISYCLGSRVKVWPRDAGLYSIRDLRDGRLPLPKDARAVQFNGPTQKPWNTSLKWAKDAWI